MLLLVISSRLFEVNIIPIELRLTVKIFKNIEIKTIDRHHPTSTTYRDSPQRFVLEPFSDFSLSDSESQSTRRSNGTIPQGVGRLRIEMAQRSVLVRICRVSHFSKAGRQQRHD